MRRGGGSAAPSAVLAFLLAATLLVAALLTSVPPARAAAGTGGATDSPVSFARSAEPAPLARSAQAPVQPAPPTPPPVPAPTITEPVTLSGKSNLWRWSFVLRATEVRAEPSSESAVVMRLKTLTPERTANLVLVLERQTVGGQQWLRVRLPMLPNNSTGWVPRQALSGYETVTTHLFVDTKRLRLRLERRGRTVLRARIGVGQKRWPTPTGEFYIRNELRGFDSPIYGPVAFGTSARSAVLTDWPGGGFIGIHGTNRPGILPGRVSHGCIRLRNPDIRRLARLMPVGTPITVS